MQSVIPPTETLVDPDFRLVEQTTSPPASEIVDSSLKMINVGPSMENVEKAFDIPLISTPVFEHVNPVLPLPATSHVVKQQSTFMQQSNSEYVCPTETTAAPIGPSTSLIEDEIFVTPVFGESPSRKVVTLEILRKSQITPPHFQKLRLKPRYKQQMLSCYQKNN